MVLIWLGIDPKTDADREKLAPALQQLMTDDPSLVVKSSANGMVTIGASSEDQLDAAVNQLVHRFGIDADISNIEIVYKETLTRAAEGQSKQRAKELARPGAHLYAHVKLRVEPGEPGSGCVFENAIVGGMIPERMIACVEAGIHEILDRGTLAGHPIDDVRVTLYDGSYHDVNSSEEAFRIAGRLAFLDAAGRAKPILLEPIMKVSIAAPYQYGSRVFDGLRQRNPGPGQIFGESIDANLGSILRGDGSEMMTISTLMPLSQMLGYGVELRARTGGLGTFTMTFSHYAPAILSEDDGDRAADVTAPLHPRTPPLILRAAVPEPRD